MSSQRNASEMGAIVCRCEGLTWAAVQRALEQFQPTSLRELKLVTRWGMGICQGRTCRPFMAGVPLSDGETTEPSGLSLHVPYKAVALSSLVDEGGQDNAWRPT